MESKVFKNSAGTFVTKGLFLEFTQPADRAYAVYTTKDEDYVGPDGLEYTSLKKLYLACDDPTEYKFANEFLGGWQHWKKIQETKDLIPHVEQWREERDIKLRSVGVRKLVEMSSSAEPSFQAAKWLADKGWDDTPKKGRPTKAAIKNETQRQAKIKSSVASDLSRIKLAK